MKKITVRNILGVFVSLAMVHALAATASIGIAKAKGSFRVDDSYVAGNATLFDGATVETGKTTGELNFSNTRVALDSGTRARVFTSRLVLDQGKVQWSGASLRTQAGSWQVVGADSGSTAVVVKRGASVVIGALAGDVKVLASNGTLLRTVGSGLAFSFTQDPAQTSDGKTADDAKKTDEDKKKDATAAAGAAGAAGAGAAAGTATAGAVGAGIATSTAVAIGVGVAAAVAIPVAVIATRSDAPASR